MTDIIEIKDIERDIVAFADAGKCIIVIPALRQFAGHRIRFDITNIRRID